MKLLLPVAFLFTTVILSCSHKNETYYRLETIEKLLYEEEDSAAQLAIDEIEYNELDTPDKTAYYNLLKSLLQYRTNKENHNDSLINISLDYYKSISNTERLAYAYFYRALITLTEYEEQCLLDLKEAEKLATKSGNYVLLTKIYSALATYNGNSYEYKEALRYSKKNLQYAQKSNNENLIAYADINLAILYVKLGQNDSALVYALEGEKYSEKLDTYYKAYIYSTLGTLYIDKDDVLAEKYLRKSLEYEKFPQTYVCLSMVLSNCGDKLGASNLWDEAIKSAYDELKIDILRAKAEYEYETDDIDACYSTMLIKDSTLADYYEWKLNNKVLEIEKKYDNNLLKQRFKNQLIVLSVIVIAAIVILVLLHRIRVRSIESKRMESELHYKKSKSMLVLLEERISNLERDKKNKSKELLVLKEKAEIIKTEIMQNLQHGHDLYDKLRFGESIADWSDFDVLCLLDFVSTINPDFAFGLENDYENLSSNQKLFLVVSNLLGKKDHEICQMFGLEKHSLYNKRNRIARKRIAA